MMQNKPSGYQALLCVVGLISLMFWGLFVLHVSLHSLMILCICWAVGHAYYIDPDMLRLKRSMVSVIQKSASVFLFFILIGAVIAGFIMSGAIPTLIYYGLQFITPQNFLPIGMLLCSLMSLVIGSCWGTIGTMGVALMGIGALLHIPAPITAGMIVSGAYVGDKFSPMSDTTMLSALTTETNLYKHIKGMTYSMLPSYLLSLAAFWWVGSYYGFEQFMVFSDVMVLRQKISSQFTIHIITLAPMLGMIWMSFKKKPAELTMLLSIFIAIGVAVGVQNFSIVAVLDSLFFGPKLPETGFVILDAVWKHGGIQSMLWSMSFTLLILILGGLLDSYQLISTLFMRLLPYLTSTFRLVATTVFAAIACNVMMGEAYLSIILTARIFKETYHKNGWDTCVLSKAIEVGSTLSTPLIPWTSSGVFISATLGTSPQGYVHWALFNWIALGIFLSMAAINFMGIRIYTQDDGA
jgi:NhaC family Na+:H+ antiporter